MKGFLVIKISINGDIQEIKENLTVRDLITKLGYTKKGFAIAINTSFVAIKSYEVTIINDGDTIDILAPVEGG